MARRWQRLLGKGEAAMQKNIVALSCIALLSTAVHAEPYQFLARYRFAPKKPDKSGKAPKPETIDVPIDEGSLIPVDLSDAQLENIVLKIRSDDYSRLSLAPLVSMHAQASIADRQILDKDIGKGEALSAADKLVELFEPGRLQSPTEVSSILLKVSAGFNPSFLCAQELHLRKFDAAPATSAEETVPGVPLTLPTRVTELACAARDVQLDRKALDAQKTAVAAGTHQPPPSTGSGKAGASGNAPADEFKTNTDTLDGVLAAIETQINKTITFEKGGSDEEERKLRELCPDRDYHDWLTRRFIREVVDHYPLHRVNGSLLPMYGSYCAEATKHIDWGAVAKILGGNPNTSETARIDDGIALAANLKSHLSDDRFGLKGLAITEDKDKPDVARERLVIARDIEASLVSEPGAVLHFEDPDGHRLYSQGTIDAGSALYLVAERDRCGSSPACTRMVSKHIKIKASGAGKDGASVNKVYELGASSEGGGRWLAATDLKDFIGGQVDVSIEYALDTDHSADVRLATGIKVRNLGFVSTVPIVTDLAALASKDSKSAISPGDIELQSSIPIAYAFGHGSEHMAVVLPWIVGYNPRSAPNLADFVKLIPLHVSLVFPVGGTGDTELAWGFGLQMSNAFTLAYARTFKSESTYWMIGLSPPDLIKLLKGKF
jgi:hypothetical protein